MYIRKRLDISIPDNLIDIEEYKLIRADHLLISSEVELHVL